MSDVASLETRLEALEKKRWDIPASNNIVVDESMRRARLAVEQASIYSATWKWVPEAYYSWPLSQRAQCLGASSIDQLCKSLLLENKKAPLEKDDPANPRFVLVLIQYAASLDVKKLVNAVRALKSVGERLEESQFDFRVASSEDNDRITGFQHNAVTPFGLKEPVAMILASAIVPQKFFWMGGGHVYLKLGMSVTEFCRTFNPIVADISVPRVIGDDELDNPQD